MSEPEHQFVAPTPVPGGTEYVRDEWIADAAILILIGAAVGYAASQLIR